jgi:hypothetical protein
MLGSDVSPVLVSSGASPGSVQVGFVLVAGSEGSGASSVAIG